jgi:hypothetical protein
MQARLSSQPEDVVKSLHSRTKGKGYFKRNINLVTLTQLFRRITLLFYPTGLWSSKLQFRAIKEVSIKIPNLFFARGSKSKNNNLF